MLADGLAAGGRWVQGYATDLWTLSRVGKLIEKISGKRYSELGVLFLPRPTAMLQEDHPQ